MIYVNSDYRRIYLDVPVTPSDGTIDVTVSDQGEQVFVVNTVVSDGDRLYFTLPFSLTQSDKVYDIHWRFNYIEDTVTYEYDNWTQEKVVTPILPLREIRAILDDTTDDEEVYEIEKAVRYIIQAHTGQFFGRYIGPISVTGVGEPTLRLPRRLISYTTINDNSLLNDYLTIRGNGWYLKTKTYNGAPSIRADSWGWHENPYTTNAPIYAPSSRNTSTFIQDVEYVIDGVWGYSGVPAQVQQAARLLVNDYASGDSVYRDRFIQSISAADWKLQFADGAFSKTGNVRVDTLLSEYVLRRGWTVI